LSATVPNYVKRHRATWRAIAARLLPAAGGAIASFLVCCAFYRAFDATVTSLGWVHWSPWTATWWAGILVPLALLALISVGILAGIAITLRRARFSHGVGPFLIGYGGLLAAWWVQNLVSIWTSCGSDPSFMGTATATPGSCFVAVVSGQWFVLGVWALFGAISALGALLVYRGYLRSRAAPSEAFPPLSSLTFEPRRGGPGRDK
jgi:hypothetical protein